MTTSTTRDRSSMRSWAMLAASGAVVGAVLRYLVGVATPEGSQWPLGTLTVNLVGAFIIGALSQIPWVMESESRRHFTMTGVLGGFTTFSAIAVEAVTMSHSDAALYVVITVVAGVALTSLGARLTSQVVR